MGLRAKSPKLGSRWFDHDRSRTWFVHRIHEPDWSTGYKQTITLRYDEGSSAGFDFVSGQDWVSRIADGRYELLHSLASFGKEQRR